MARLYEISERYKNLAALLEDETIDKDAVEEALNSIEGEFIDKALNVARYIKNLESDVKAIKEERDRLYKRETAYTEKCKWFKAYLEREMVSSNITKVEDPILPLSLRESPASVEIEPGAKIPKAYLISQEPKVDKRGILEALKNGEKFKGIRLVEDRKYLKIG